jgi:hypothetical protein
MACRLLLIVCFHFDDAAAQRSIRKDLSDQTPGHRRSGPQVERSLEGLSLGCHPFPFRNLGRPRPGRRGQANLRSSSSRRPAGSCHQASVSTAGEVASPYRTWLQATTFDSDGLTLGISDRPVEGTDEKDLSLPPILGLTQPGSAQIEILGGFSEAGRVGPRATRARSVGPITSRRCRC